MSDTKRTVIKTNEGDLVMKRNWDESSNVKMIIISPSIETIEADCFANLSHCIIEVSEKLWKNHIIKKHWVYGHISGTQIFKVVPKNGKYYYLYCYISKGRIGDRGPYNIEYYQMIGKFEYDEYIDEELLDKYYKDENISNKVMVRLCRLATPQKLSKEHQTRFVTFLKRNYMEGMEKIAKFDCPDLLRALFQYDIVKKKDIDTIKEILAKHDAKECIEQFEKMQTAK